MLLADGIFLARLGDGDGTFPTTTMLVNEGGGCGLFMGDERGERRSGVGPMREGLGGNKASGGLSKLKQ